MTDEDLMRRTSRAPLHADDLPFYTVGQVAMLLEIPAGSLRRLDVEGIVRPKRSGGGQRRYSRNDVEQLREVAELTHEGVTLPGVRRVLDLRRRVDELEAEVAGLKAELDERER
ncbi:MerR family transcriptional regulator, heat shock protein HspR [Propionibacterium cyclohexanicum]|uniref:MerR family transcriptional regulator, heat shock protein HspR n=1 Tax=Propionibacterium cyclohexanicum TaxID=64702 RepID=A0A1H9RYU0_9ACTN|nr:MerR family transcriptional regulator [Propionibacterium cyclohexanicum]SER77818.1 MerR family transcriptional regulator, heat shock protein HspR [Propionibacterium cyclohexanicum]